jgi:hypothetical protein
MSTNIAYPIVAVIVALALVLISQFFMKNVKTRKNFIWIAGVIGVISIVLIASGTWMDQGILLGGTSLISTYSVTGAVQPDLSGGNTNQQIDVTGCDLGTKTTVTLSGQDAYNTSATGGTHRYSINGATQSTVSDAGTLTVSPGDQLSVLWYNGATTGYFSKATTYTIPCTGAKTYSEKLVVNGSITSTVYNANDQVVTLASGVNQTLSAGDVKNVRIKLAGAFEHAFPYGFVAVIESNKTAIDSAKILIGGAEAQIGVIPQSDTPMFDGTISQRVAYVLPALESTNDFEYKLMLDADDTYGAVGTGAENVTVRYYPMNIFLNEKAGGKFDGPSAEDETNTLTRDGQYSSVVYYD